MTEPELLETEEYATFASSSSPKTIEPKLFISHEIKKEIDPIIKKEEREGNVRMKEMKELGIDQEKTFRKI